jgi:2-(1,2-epoxy-1,2-dihydrophenyl)acetyl-CoA isomerase
MPHRFLQSETAAGVQRVTLDRPDVLNSFHTLMAAEFLHEIRHAAESVEVRCVLITGAGRAFCAGQDLEEVHPAEGQPLEDFAAHVRKVYNPIVRGIRGLEKPVVAAVNGVAAGAGASLALACDFVIASTKASFIQAFSKIGLIPDTGATFILPRLVGTAQATAMMMLGEKISAERALELGMIYRVTEPDALMTEATTFAESLAQGATHALGLTKRLLNESVRNDLDAQLELEADLQGTAGRSEDYVEGVRAFLEKRTPEFKGR